MHILRGRAGWQCFSHRFRKRHTCSIITFTVLVNAFTFVEVQKAVESSENWHCYQSEQISQSMTVIWKHLHFVFLKTTSPASTCSECQQACDSKRTRLVLWTNHFRADGFNLMVDKRGSCQSKYVKCQQFSAITASWQPSISTFLCSPTAKGKNPMFVSAWKPREYSNKFNRGDSATTSNPLPFIYHFW